MICHIVWHWFMNWLLTLQQQQQMQQHGVKSYQYIRAIKWVIKNQLQWRNYRTEEDISHRTRSFKFFFHIIIMMFNTSLAVNQQRHWRVTYLDNGTLQFMVFGMNSTVFCNAWTLFFLFVEYFMSIFIRRSYYIRTQIQGFSVAALCRLDGYCVFVLFVSARARFACIRAE